MTEFFEKLLKEKTKQISELNLQIERLEKWKYALMIVIENNGLEEEADKELAKVFPDKEED